MSKDANKNNNNVINKIFSSPYKDEIEKRIAIGNSPRAISKWLETRGESISYVTINKYKKEFFNTEAQIGKIVEDKQKETEMELEKVESVEEIEEKQRKLLETQRNQHLATITAVNHIVVLYQNIQDMRQYLETLKRYEPVVAAHAAKGLFQEIRATIETLEKIKANSGEANNSSVARMISQLKVQKKEMEELAKQRKNEQ